MQMNEPQVWTLIGFFAVFMVSALTVLIRQNDMMIVSFRRELSEQFAGMDAKFGGRIETMDAKFEGRFGALDAKFESRFETMDAKFDSRLESIDRRLEDLDKEVANLATRFWGSR